MELNRFLKKWIEIKSNDELVSVNLYKNYSARIYADAYELEPDAWVVFYLNDTVVGGSYLSYIEELV